MRHEQIGDTSSQSTQTPPADTHSVNNLSRQYFLRNFNLFERFSQARNQANQQPQPEYNFPIMPINRRTFNKLAVSATVALAATGIRSSTEIDDWQSVPLEQSTGLSTMELRSDYGMEVEEVIEHPESGDDTIILAPQTHYHPSRNGGISEIRKVVRSQDRLEKFIRHLVEKKGITEVFTEGMTIGSEGSWEFYAEEKRKMETTELTPQNILYFVDGYTKFRDSVAPQANTLEEFVNLPLTEDEVIVNYLYQPTIQAAAERVQNLTDADIPPELEEKVRLIYKEVNKLNAQYGYDPVPAKSAREYIADKVNTAVEEMNGFLKNNGLRNFREGLMATTRLGLEGLITVMPSESKELNERAITLVDELQNSSTAFGLDPSDENEERFLKAKQRFDNEFPQAQKAREELAIQLVANSPGDNPIKLLIYGDIHTFKDALTEHNEDPSTNHYGMIRLGQVK